MDISNGRRCVRLPLSLGADAGQLKQLLGKAGELGRADTPLAALNGHAQV
ncbi:hypothetical protein [Streptomyces sp. enrichment culture]